MVDSIIDIDLLKNILKNIKWTIIELETIAGVNHGIEIQIADGEGNYYESNELIFPLLGFLQRINCSCCHECEFKFTIISNGV